MRDSGSPGMAFAVARRRMKVALVIAALGRGGAERQLMQLATGLRRAGHDVEVWCYGGASDLDKGLRAAGMQVLNASGTGKRGKIGIVRRWMRDRRPDVVHAFMKRASVLSVLARGLSRDIKVLASDMSTATYNRRNLALWPSLLLFGGADGVVTQTELNRRSLQTLAPWLRGKVRVVRNGLDFNRFLPTAAAPPMIPFRFCIVGSVYAVKNPAAVVAAVAELRRRGVGGFRVDWYGRLGLGGDRQPSQAYEQAVEQMTANGLEPWLTFHGETRDILSAYQGAHALIHVSLQEGFPNAVVEAMGCGLPIIASQVSDLPQVVAEADNGRIVPAHDAPALADAMEWLMGMDAGQRAAMGMRSRELAIRWFGEERFVAELVDLYQVL